MMRKNRAGQSSAQYFGKAASAFLLLAGLTCLVGCQGVSAAGSGQQQTGSLSFGSLSVDFGSVTAGSSKTLTVTATNSGTTSVTISSASASTKYFSLAAPGLPLAVPAGQTTPISIQFTPNAAGAFNATLAVTSGASNTVASNTVTNLTLS